MHQQKTRTASIDTFRVVGIFAVILIHTFFLKDISGFKIAYGLIQNMCRFAVPFFFIVSGYLFAQKAHNEALLSVLWKYAKRILMLFFGWSLIYAIIPRYFVTIFEDGVSSQLSSSFIKEIVNNFREILIHPFFFLLSGTSYHLWFFPALIMGMVILSILIFFRQEKYLLLYSFSLFLIGLLLFSNIFHLHIHPSFRYGNGPFYSTSLFALAWWIARRRVVLGFLSSILLILTGFIIKMIEVYCLHSFFGGACTIGDTLMGIGVFFVALARPSLGRSLIIFRLAPFVLGIYALHVLIIGNIPYFLGKMFTPLIWQIVYPFLVFVISILMTMFLGRYKVTKWLVG